ncbi:MAG: hypothetical protein CMG35_11390 [Candidatus Marinimicrobia bacterium]|nr:hypothetical protein [Candidatus Neomarinimicrobiota bacterium]|tara:strand:- start:17766 stop:18005 length:240 start_codon:yes stop_codon:yes gene_type:complete
MVEKSIDYSKIEPYHYSDWLGSLSFDDLQRLRKVVRLVHMKNYPKRQITNREMDRIIEAIGPRVAEQQLKALIDAGKLN